MDRQFRILKITHPVGNAEMHQVKDRCYFQPLHFIHHIIRKAPVESAGSLVDGIIGQPVAEYVEAQIFYQLEIFSPVIIMAAFLQQISSDCFVPYRRIRTFNTRGKHKFIISHTTIYHKISNLPSSACYSFLYCLCYIFK